MMPPDWISKLGKLNPNVSKTKGAGNARFAPHKALLLLCMIDLAEAGELGESELGKTPELRLRFDSYWRIVQARWGGRPGLDLPFHHLGNQGFWTPLTRDSVTSISPDTTVCLTLDPGFLACLYNREFRRQARFILIRIWFPDVEQQALLTALGISKAEARREEFKLREESLSTGRRAVMRDSGLLW